MNQLPVPGDTPQEWSLNEAISRLLSKYRHLNPIWNTEFWKVELPSYNHPIDLDRWWISQLFGVNPQNYKPLKGHDGIDYACNRGTPVMCPADWMDITDLILQKNSYGRHAWGKDNYGHRHIFGHLSEFCCEKGQRVYRGETFALSGGNLEDPYHGFSTGPHCHWELRPSWASISNGYAGAEDQLPYCTYGHVSPIPIPEPEPLFWLEVLPEGDQVRERTRPTVNPYNLTGVKFPTGTRIPVYADSLEGKIWIKNKPHSESWVCWKDNKKIYMVVKNA